MAKALWNGVIIAEADAGACEVVEGNLYFPLAAVKPEFFTASATKTVCPWKGTASYFDLIVDGQVNKDAAWYYPAPKSAAENITGYVAFWRGVQVER